MTGNIYFQISGLLYITLLIWVFFSKKRNDSIENNVLITMVITNLVSLVFDVLNTYFVLNLNGIPMISNIISKFTLILIVFWLYLLTLYIFILSFNKKERVSDDKQKLLKDMVRKSGPIVGVALLAILVIPVESNIVNNAIVTGGLGVSYLYVLSGIFILVWLLRFIKRKDQMKLEKRNIVLFLIILGLVTLVVQVIYPELLFMNLIRVFITVYVYFTIKNPDLDVLDELKEARYQVEQVNAEKANVLLDVSRDIRTPLNTIIGFGESLMEEDVSSQAKEDIKYMMMASHSLLEMVNGVLGESPVEMQRLRIKEDEYNLEQVLKQVVSIANNKLSNKKVELRTKIDSKLPKILYGDNIRIKQIILNVLNNAIEHTTEGYIELEVSGILKGNVLRLIVSVEDTGEGIPKDKLSQVFNKIQRHNEEKELSIDGEGTNLAMTKKLVELMNGRINVVSEYKEGSKFTIAIDQKLSAGPSKIDTNDEIKDESKFDISGKKILIVDDNQMNLKVASRLLKAYNVETAEVSSGLECLNRINDKEEYDLIFLDDMMPGMSGVETLNRLRKKEFFNTPVVALTANASVGMKDKYISLGFNDYISKPIDRKELKRVLKKFLVNK